MPEQEWEWPLNIQEQETSGSGQRPARMPEPPEDLIVRNLIEALQRLCGDIDRMELWAAALGSFRDPIPDYRPGEQYLLKPSDRQPRRPGF
ncbi:MAG: hypothetical protein WCA56_19095 [Xanthobacteraceae bacterium]